jgi:tetratricopeptide (TPR) repeat protein
MDRIEKILEKVLELEKNKDYKKLIGYLTDSRLNFYKNARLYSIKGAALARPPIKNSLLKSAVACFTNAVTLEPENPVHLCDRAGVWRKLKEFGKSLNDINEALKLDNRNPGFYIERAKTYVRLHDFKAMKSDLAKAVSLDPKNPRAYYLRSDFWRAYRYFKFKGKGIGTWRNEVADLEHAIKLDKHAAEAVAYFKLGNLYLRNGKYEQAFLNFNSALQKDDSVGDWEMDVFLNIYNALQPLDEVQRAKIYNVCHPVLDVLDALKYYVEIDPFEGQHRGDDLIVHYTKLFAADILFSSDDNKMRFYHSSGMNDPEEGKILALVFDHPDIEHAFAEADVYVDNNFYIGSFLPEKHADDLVMWRTYGKDENDNEAKGCSIVIDRKFFEKEREISKQINLNAGTHVVAVEKKDGKPPASVRKGKKDGGAEVSRPRFNTSLYKVIYYDKRTKTVQYPSSEDARKFFLEMVKELKELLLKIIAFKRTDDHWKDNPLNKVINKIVHHIITEFSYYFKSSDYAYENEFRIIISVPPKNEMVKIDDRGPLPKRFYVEAKNPLRPYVRKVILGPKVSNPERWSYLKVKMIKSDHKIEIKKSECKFQ